MDSVVNTACITQGQPLAVFPPGGGGRGAAVGTPGEGPDGKVDCLGGGATFYHSGETAGG